MTRVEVSVHILQWALDRNGTKADSLRERFPKLREWLGGDSLPTLRQLEEFAKASGTPLGYFFLTEPPIDQLGIPHFRTATDEALRGPSPELLETVQIMERRQSWMREFLVEQGVERLPFIMSIQQGDSPRSVAELMRRTLGLESAWASEHRTWTDALRALIQATENAKIMVVINGIVGNNTHRKLDASEFRGFVLVDEFAPLVFINGTDGRAAQMFTLAHELAHLWLGSSAAFDLRGLQPAADEGEQACNRIAAEFLVPEQELLRAWSSLRLEVEPFQAAARQFKVSTIVAARRALDLRLITGTEFASFYQSYLEDERRIVSNRAGGGDYYANQNQRIGRRFAHAVLEATARGSLLFRDAYQLTGLTGKTFEHWAESFGVGESR